MADFAKKAEEAIKTIPPKYRGPGGAIAILKDGQLVQEHSWGFADLDKRLPLTRDTQIPICSISKQMVCMMLFDLISNSTPAILSKGGNTWDLVSKELESFLPNDLGKKLTLANLCNNQSGIRDYWAMTTLWGAHPEQRFSLERDAPEALKRTRSLHFEPGTEYSYCNLNFHILARLLEKVSEVPIEELLKKRLFEPAGMSSTALLPDTALMPKPCVGYEGDDEHGWYPAVNRIEWSGDAGIISTLKDMIAYEQHLDRSWNDPKSPYRRIAEPQTYHNGHPAPYGYGLGSSEIGGKRTLGHGGALRGFRLYRAHVPEERISVVILFNHEADSGAPANDILKKLLDVKKEDEKALFTKDQLSHWNGDFLDADRSSGTQLAVQIKPDDEGKLNVAYTRAGRAEKAKLIDEITARADNMEAKIEGDYLFANRHKENRSLIATRIAKGKTPASDDFAGDYHCADADSFFHCTGEGGLLYGAFDGYLGKGPEHLMRYLGGDVFALANPRGLDAAAPGDWTCVFRRNDQGKITGVTIGCWLARKLEFVRQG